MEDSQRLSNATECRETLIMAKLKNSLLSQLAIFNPSISVNSNLASFIQRQIQELFGSFHTPTHPPYSLMIQKAIMELNEESGSTEEAICEFIRTEYRDLPLAHVRILDHQLRKLCIDGELLCTKDGRYMVDDGGKGNGEETECKGSKKRKKGKGRRSNGGRVRSKTVESGQGIKGDNGLQEQEVNKQIQVFELHDVGFKGEDTECNGNKRRKGGEKSGSSGDRERNKTLECGQGFEGNNGLQDQEVNEPIEVSESHGVGFNEEETECKGSKKRKKGERRRNNRDRERNKTLESGQGIEGNKGLQDLEVYEQIQVSELDGVGTNDPSGVVELKQQEEWAREHWEAHQQSTETVEEHGKSDKEVLRAAELEQLSQSCSQGTGVTEEHTEAEKYQGRMAQAQSKGQEPQIQEAIITYRALDRPPLKRRGRPPKSKTVTGYTGKSLLPSDDGILNEQKANTFKLQQQLQPGLHVRGRSRGRPPKHRNSHQYKEQLQPQDQAQGVVASPQSEPKEMIYSSQTTAMNLPGGPSLKSEPHLPVPISEQSPECTISVGIESSSAQLQMQVPSDIGLCANMESSLFPVNDHKQPQHWDQASLEAKLDKNPMSGDPAPNPPMHRRRGRPPKSKNVANYPILNKMEKQQQQQCCVRCRGKPPKLNQNANQCEEQLQSQDQGQGLVSPLNSGRADNQNLVKQQLQSQSQVQSDRGCPELEPDVDKNCQKQQLLPQVKERGRGRPPKTSTHAKQQQLLKFQGQDPNEGLGLERLPNPSSDASQSSHVLQPKPSDVQRKRFGRPPKQSCQCWEAGQGLQHQN